MNQRSKLGILRTGVTWIAGAFLVILVAGLLWSMVAGGKGDPDGGIGDIRKERTSKVEP